MALAAWLAASPGWAQEAVEPDGDPLWRAEWTPVRPWEWLLAAGAFLITETSFQASLHASSPRGPDWRTPILFDNAVRDWTRIESRQGRQSANAASDVLSLWTVNYPFVDIFTALILRRDSYAATQMGGMLLESTAAANLTVRLMQTAVRRERPLSRECDADPSYDGLCDDPERYTAFWSGHTAGAFAGAGLTCAWHVHMPLYGGSWVDALPCATSLVLAGVGGYLRVASDRHYLSDVLVGAGVGFFLGYGLPTLLHFTDPDDPPAPEPTVRGVTPLLADELIGLLVSGDF